MSKFILSAFADEIAADLKTQMDILEQHDICHIEMRGVNGRNLVEHSLDEVREIKKILDQRGFKISAVGSPIGKIKITDDFEPHLKLFKHTIEIAKILETSYIRMFSFFIPAAEDPKAHREEVMRRWSQFIEAAAGSGLILLHENEKEIYGDTPERCLDLLNTMHSDSLKAIFDPANFVQCDVKTYPEAFDLLKDQVVYLHIKDAVYADHHVTPAGEGDGKIREILKALHERDFSGFLSLEPHLDGSSLPGGGPKLFGVACEALKRILSEVTAVV